MLMNVLKIGYKLIYRYIMLNNIILNKIYNDKRKL